MTEEEMAGWYHGLGGHEFEQTTVDSKEQGILACCGPWGHRAGDKTQQLNKKQQQTYTITNISVKGKFLVDGNVKWF